MNTQKKETTNRWAEFLETGRNVPLAVNPRTASKKTRIVAVSPRQRRAILHQGEK